MSLYLQHRQPNLVIDCSCILTSIPIGYTHPWPRDTRAKMHSPRALKPLPQAQLRYAVTQQLACNTSLNLERRSWSFGPSYKYLLPALQPEVSLTSIIICLCSTYDLLLKQGYNERVSLSATRLIRKMRLRRSGCTDVRSENDSKLRVGLVHWLIAEIAELNERRSWWINEKF